MEVVKMPRIICVECSEKEGKAVFLRVVKNGIKLRYGYYLGYHLADLYQCPKCGRKFISGIADAEVFDPDAEVDFNFSEVR